MLTKLKSRKFLLALVGAVVMVLNEGLGLNLPKDTILGFAAIIIAYLVAEGAADAIGALKK